MALARSGQPEPDSGFLGWWLGEMRGLLPRRWRQGGSRRYNLLLQLERPFARVYERRGRRLDSVGSLVLPGAGADAQPPLDPRLRRALARHRDTTLLVLGEQDALTCTDLLPAAAEGDLARIMGHKLDLLTPWSAEQGYAAQKVLGRRRDGMLEVLVAAASRPRLDELLRNLAAVGVTPAAVDVALAGDTQRTAGVDLLRGGAPERRGPRLLGILFVTLLLAVAGAVALVGWQVRQKRQLLAEQAHLAEALEQRLADLPELRARVDALQAQARFFADDRGSRPSPLLVLEVLSRLLPDTVWLTETTLDGNELSISGLAEDASTLIPLVEAAPEFEQVRFQAPSTRVTVRGADGGDRQVERFALRAIVDPSVEPVL